MLSASRPSTCSAAFCSCSRASSAWPGCGLCAAGLSVDSFGRQLGTAAKRELIRIALAESPEDSHRKIATRLGVGHTFVDKVCREEVDSESTSECRHGLTGQGARTDRKAAPRPQVSKEDLLARNAQIVREHDAGLSWSEISERDGLRPQGARDVNRIAMGGPDTPRARVRAHRSRLETR